MRFLLLDAGQVEQVGVLAAVRDVPSALVGRMSLVLTTASELGASNALRAARLATKSCGAMGRYFMQRPMCKKRHRFGIQKERANSSPSWVIGNRSRRREAAERTGARPAGNPPPHGGGYVGAIKTVGQAAGNAGWNRPLAGWFWRPAKTLACVAATSRRTWL